jgi:hypothetical protein
MNVLAGLGYAAEGFAKGALMAEKIKDMKDKRDQREIEKEIRQAGVDILGADDEEPITVENPTGGIAPPSNQNSQLPAGLGSLDYTSPNEDTQLVQKFADGGMVQDQNSMVAQVNQGIGLDSMQQQPAAAPQQKQKPNYGAKLSKAYSAMRDKAIALGRPDLAGDYQNLGFQIRDRLYKEGITNAQRSFDMTGDIGGFVKVYNDVIDDDAKVDSYERTENGYKLKLNIGGQTVEREFKPEQIRDMVMSFNDPAARYAAERVAMEARNKKTFETDEDIRKEKAKLHTVGLDSVVVDGTGKTVYDGSANRPKFKNDQEVYQAANDPQDPRNQLAKSMIKQMREEKVSVAVASRAPKEPKEKSLDDRAYEDWKAKPENASKGISDFLKDKASWGKDIGLDTVTTSTSTIDPTTGAETSKESRVTKVPRGESTQSGKKKDFDLHKYL